MKLSHFILLPFILIALFFSACTQDASQFQSDTKTEKKIKVKVINFNDSISNPKYANIKEYKGWYDKAKDLRFEYKRLDSQRYGHKYNFILVISDSRFSPDAYAADHKNTDITLPGGVYRSSNLNLEYDDAVLCDKIDSLVFEIVE